MTLIQVSRGWIGLGVFLLLAALAGADLTTVDVRDDGADTPFLWSDGMPTPDDAGAQGHLAGCTSATDAEAGGSP